MIFLIFTFFKVIRHYNKFTLDIKADSAIELTTNIELKMHKNLSFATAVLLPNFSSAIGFENNSELAPDAMQFGQTTIDHIINPVSL